MEEIAKLLVLAVFAALFIAFVKLGPEGPKAWWKAKFLGEPTVGKAGR
jgi:hypothetical protein